MEATKKIVDYQVVEIEGNIHNFNAEVKKQISEGWEPFKNFSVISVFASVGQSKAFYQPMVKYQSFENKRRYPLD